MIFYNAVATPFYLSHKGTKSTKTAFDNSICFIGVRVSLCFLWRGQEFDA